MDNIENAHLVVSEAPLDWDMICAAHAAKDDPTRWISAEESERRFDEAIRRGAEEGDRIRKGAQSA